MPAEPDLVAGAVDACAQRGVWAVLDELAVGEVAQPNTAAVSDRIASGDGELQRFGRECVGSDPVALRSERQVNEREIDLSVRGASHEFWGANVMDPQRHRRMPAVKAADQPGEVDRAKRLDGTDRHMSAHQAAYTGHSVPAVLGRSYGTPGRWQERPASLGQLDLAGAADEQVAAKFALERANRARQA
jgi:hypothetical protein